MHRSEIHVMWFPPAPSLELHTYKHSVLLMIFTVHVTYAPKRNVMWSVCLSVRLSVELPTHKHFVLLLIFSNDSKVEMDLLCKLVSLWTKFNGIQLDNSIIQQSFELLCHLSHCHRNFDHPLKVKRKNENVTRDDAFFFHRFFFFFFKLKTQSCCLHPGRIQCRKKRKEK